jgi:hypothetical protein
MKEIKNVENDFVSTTSREKRPRNIKEETASAGVGHERAFPYYYAKFGKSRLRKLATSLWRNQKRNGTGRPSEKLRSP